MSDAHADADADRNAIAEQILRDHGTRVYNLARRMLGSVEDAEDVAQEVFLKVFQHLDEFRGEAALGTWIHRITVNAALEFRERRARRPVAVGDPFDDFLEDGRRARPVEAWSDDPEQAVLDGEARQMVEKAIAELPEAYRDVYVLTDVEKLPILQAAEMLTLGVPAMKSRLHRARLMLRKKLAAYFEEAQA
ncbi:MAG: sigma-70 family RNA polymerase sigma factor [Planctomycetes bacterium]|nr:sigma-70 family RNA polymerase sigma factor [Planctomycetota bacterium]